MQQWVIELFVIYREAAVVISIFLNIVISVLGVVPSVFLTAANIFVFGLVEGTVISALGEAAGAAVSFALYRKGFRKWAGEKLPDKTWIQRLLRAHGRDAFFLVFGLRLLPFVPSGLVTFVAAIGTVSVGTFVASSTLGKIPALIMEAYSIYQVTEWTIQGKIILLAIGCAFLYVVFTRLRRR
ncbi:TVP38/TMEM64 family protein [Bacillus sp. EB01]|uniref:TVP38/TMEM64 family protein n=1 Tax=Bacillus sp. EB01 TaxID=1347086 RepID=UPI0005C533F0|nr:VTT domain-containing protein [Bacillus sp. EB01]